MIAGTPTEAGRKDVPFTTAAFLFTILDDDYDAALDRAANLLQMIYIRPFRDAAKKYCLVGRPGRLSRADPGLRRRRLPSVRALAADGPRRVRGAGRIGIGAGDPSHQAAAVIAQ